MNLRIGGQYKSGLVISQRKTGYKYRAARSERRRWQGPHPQYARKTRHLRPVRQLASPAVGRGRQRRLPGSTTCSDRRRIHREGRFPPFFPNSAVVLPLRHTSAHSRPRQRWRRSPDAQTRPPVQRPPSKKAARLLDVATHSGRLYGTMKISATLKPHLPTAGECRCVSRGIFR